MTGRTALLIMDVQVGVVERFGGEEAHLGPMATAIEAARARGILVVYVRVAFRPGLPEVSRRNKTFSALAETAQARFREDDASTRIHRAISPEDGDIVVTKRRVSAFSGSDLDLVLRAAEIDTLRAGGYRHERRGALYDKGGGRPGLSPRRTLRWMP